MPPTVHEISSDFTTICRLVKDSLASGRDVLLLTPDNVVTFNNTIPGTPLPDLNDTVSKVRSGLSSGFISSEWGKVSEIEQRLRAMGATALAITVNEATPDTERHSKLCSKLHSLAVKAATEVSQTENTVVIVITTGTKSLMEVAKATE